MSNELKPCPFCGSKARYHEWEKFHDVHCADDEGCICPGWHEFDSKAAAYDTWNTRPIEDALRWQIVELKAALEFQKSAARQLSGMTNIGISVYDALTPEQIKLLRSGKPCRWVLEEA